MLDGEARLTRSRHEFFSEHDELPFVVFLGMPHLLLRDEGPGTLLSFQQAANLHLLISPEDSIRIDRQIDSYRAHGRQLIAYAEEPEASAACT